MEIPPSHAILVDMGIWPPITDFIKFHNWPYGATNDVQVVGPSGCPGHSVAHYALLKGVFVLRCGRTITRHLLISSTHLVFNVACVHIYVGICIRTRACAVIGLVLAGGPWNSRAAPYRLLRSHRVLYFIFSTCHTPWALGLFSDCAVHIGDDIIPGLADSCQYLHASPGWVEVLIEAIRWVAHDDSIRGIAGIL